MVKIFKFRLKGKEGSALYNRTAGEKVVYAIVFLLFALYTFIMTFPFIWLLYNSLKSSYNYYEDYEKLRLLSLPFEWRPRNYIEAFSSLKCEGVNLFGMIFNSVWYTAVVVIEGVFFSACTGYCLSKYDFKLRGTIYFIAIFSMTIPVVGTLPASFKLSGDLGILDTPLQPILSCAGGFGFNFLIMYAFYKNMPWSYAEAVFIDGGNDFKAFFKVMLPMAKAPMITLSIISAISCWNDYTSIILFMRSYPTLAAGLYTVKANIQLGEEPIYYAALLMSMLPVLVVFAAFSEQIMKNMSVGGLKG
ncbi:MAG: carbohydrate ABC transporter permease [Clostridia bacterium]|jgi:ABC-type glycerol-3-phosphate transport system permease component|nr:carbohydrate ABC transporter permease [Clostridia bacterium]